MKMFNFANEEEVLSFLRTRKDIKFIKIIFPDVLGRRMSFTIPASEMRDAFKNGKGFDGSSVEGFARVEESDLIIVPEAKTFRVLPWEYSVGALRWKEGVIFGDIFTPGRKHFQGDSRYVLKKVLQESKHIGKLYAGPELEFFLFENEKEPRLLDKGGYFYGDHRSEIRKGAQLYLQEMGIGTEYDHHEVAPSQHEIDIKYKDAVTTADSIVLAKYVIKRVAREMGFFASFMPKPITGVNGSGMHLHLSLWEGRKNLFFKSKEDPLSDLAKQYLTGLIKYGQEFQIILNQWINSYKRLMPGYEAPVYLAWGTKNRSAYIRFPENSLQKAKNSTRIESRSPDPACNIYLALAIMQNAGIQGIKENLKILPPQEEDIFAMKKSDAKKKNIKVLSGDLNEALKKFKKSKLCRKALGEHLFRKIVQNKEIEWGRYKKEVGKKFAKEVSPYEVEEYLPVL